MLQTNVTYPLTNIPEQIASVCCLKVKYAEWHSGWLYWNKQRLIIRNPYQQKTASEEQEE